MFALKGSDRQTAEKENKMTKAEQYLLNHLTPVEYRLYHDTYLCGVAVNNKDKFIYSMLDKVKAWVIKNGGRYTIISNKVINHRLNQKGFVIQIVFPAGGKRDMKNVMATLFTKNMTLPVIE